MPKKEPGIYFGWYIVMVSMLITILTVGLRMGIGPFVMPIMEDLNISRTALSAVLFVSMLMYGVGMPLAGYLCERYSTKFVLLLGLTIIEFSIIATVFTKNIWVFSLTYGVLLSFGLSFTSPIAVTPIISRWFVRQRGKALFFLSTGSMAGIAVFNPLATAMIQWIGWRDTLSVFAVIFIILVVPAALWIFKEKVPKGADQLLADSEVIVSDAPKFEQKITWRDAIRTRAYWQIVAGLFACGFSMNLLGSHAVPMLIDHHFDPATASYGVGLIGLIAIFSTLVLGSIADRFPRKNILFWVYFIRGLGFLGLVYAQCPWQLYLVATLGGLVWAGSVALSSAILGDLFGVSLVGVLYGWAYFGHQIGGAIASFLGGWGYENFETHVFSFGLATLILMIGAVVSYFIPKQVFISHYSQEQRLSKVKHSTSNNSNN